MKKKNIIAYLIAFILLAVLVGIYLYQKPTELTSTGSADFEYTLPDLVEKGVTESDTSFNVTHVNKKVKLTGQVNSKNIQNSGSTLFFETDNENVIVAAAFDASLNQELESIQLGSSVEVLCICNGIAKPEDPEDLLSETTLSFNRCSLLNTKTNDSKVQKP